jgi:hypothetical protein
MASSTWLCGFPTSGDSGSERLAEAKTEIFEKKIDVDEITDGLDVGKHKAIELFLGFPAEGIGVSVILRTSTSNSSKSIGMALGEVVPSFEITRREFSASQNGYGEPDRNGRCAISAEQLRARMLPDGKAYKIFANDFQRNLSSRERVRNRSSKTGWFILGPITARRSSASR